MSATRRALIVLALIACPAIAEAHIGSPDVFFEGDAGSYHLAVTIRVPQVIPGVATVEVRASDPGVEAISVVPMRLTGPGSQLPPAPDAAIRSTADPQFFTADLWLMERGSLQVRIAASGAHGIGTLAVPVPAVAQSTLAMPRGLGGLLFALMLLLATSLVSIVVAAVREATLPVDGTASPSGDAAGRGQAPAGGAPRRSRLRTVIATVVTTAIVAGIIAFGNWWWTSDARGYAATIGAPWHAEVTVAGCDLALTLPAAQVLPDHGHDVHLFLIRTPGVDQLTHLHPVATVRGSNIYHQALPPLPAGHYQVFADIVLPTGFPLTGTAELDLPALTCPAVTGDDTAWAGVRTDHRPTIASPLADGATMLWDRPRELHAGAAQGLTFRVVDRDGNPATDLEPYMGMVAHAEVVRTDMAVFAHLHPDGSVAMPALDLVRGGADMAGMPGMAPTGPLSPTIRIPYGFPSPGWYRVFVQIKRAGQIETAAFDANVLPPSSAGSR